MEVGGIDLFGPIRETPRKNSYVLTITCLFSKWVSAYPLQDKQATTVADKLVEFFAVFGPPKAIISDHGTEFINSVKAVLLSKFQISHRVAGVRHPQSNGQDERTNGTMKHCLAKLVNDRQSDWDEFLSLTVFAINSTKQASTKISPYKILELSFGSRKL